MPPQPADVKTASAFAKDLEPAIAGHLFLGGTKPSQEDVDAFNAMLGEDNIALHRWIRNMASFTEQERNSWVRPE